MYCDTHCHLEFEDFDPDRGEVIAGAKAADLAFIINPGIDLPSSRKAVDLAAQHPAFIYAAIGTHPNYVAEGHDGDMDALRELADEPGVVAIGEIGLDYYRDYALPADQRRCLLAQLALASDLQLPVILHNREADIDLLPILRDWWRGLDSQNRLKAHPGVLHYYSGSAEPVPELAAMGFMFGVDGPITFQNAKERRLVMAALPLDHVLLETDAPFLAPHPHRGRRNEPAYIPLMAAELAKIHAKSCAEIGDITTANAQALFNISTS